MLHRWLIRRLRPQRLPHVRQPTDVGVPAEAAQAVRLTAVDGGKLFAWLIRPDAVSEGATPAVVVMHGWGSNGGDLLPGAESLRRAGFIVLVLDARCHGHSDDADFTSMPRFAEDIESGVNWLLQRPEVDAGRVMLIGHSVGAAAALLLASRRPDVSAVVSLSAFAHPADMMKRWLNARGIPMWPLGVWVLSHVQKVIGSRFDDIAPAHTLTVLKAPVLLVHGDQDEVTPVTDLQRLVDAAHGRAVQKVRLPGVGHDLSSALDEHILPHILRFLREPGGQTTH